MEPLPHIKELLDGTLRSCFFTEFELASSYHQLLVLASDRWKTSFRSQLGQFEWNVVLFGLQGSLSLLMRVMNEALSVGLGPSSAVSGGRPGASDPPPGLWVSETFFLERVAILSAGRCSAVIDRTIMCEKRRD